MDNYKHYSTRSIAGQYYGLALFSCFRSYVLCILSKKMMKILRLFIIMLLIVGGYFLIYSHSVSIQSPLISQKPATTITVKKLTEKSLTITSSAFFNYETIPTKYTCDGENLNPPLTFSDVSSKAKSLVLLVEDPDVLNHGIFEHWVVYNISPTARGIAENAVPPDASQGLNSAGQEKYTGPCPPDREHRYFFKLYALNISLDFFNPLQVTKQMVIDKMQAHILEQAELVGVYNRPQNRK